MFASSSTMFLYCHVHYTILMQIGSYTTFPVFFIQKYCILTQTFIMRTDFCCSEGWVGSALKVNLIWIRIKFKRFDWLKEGHKQFLAAGPLGIVCTFNLF